MPRLKRGEKEKKKKGDPRGFPPPTRGKGKGLRVFSKSPSKKEESLKFHG